MLMMQMILVALAELTKFNINFIAVINVLSIYCHIRNTLKQYLGKTVDEFCIRWYNKKTVFRNVTNNTRQTICKNHILMLATVVFQIMSR